jgi:predicted phosphate transport protein (TIGR00153 family)
VRNLFLRKQAHIEQGFEAFLGCIQRCVEIFCTGMLSYLEHGPGESFDRASALVARAESEADTLRKDIERVLYKNELLPDSRGDLLNLLESCDKVANRIESVIRRVCLRQVQIPDEIKTHIKEMLVPVQTCVETLITAIRLLFPEPSRAKPAIDDVERLESECDKIQQATTRLIFRMDLDLARQLLLEQTINDIGSIADRAEDASHLLEIIAIKRAL